MSRGAAEYAMREGNSPADKAKARRVVADLVHDMYQAIVMVRLRDTVPLTPYFEKQLRGYQERIAAATGIPIGDAPRADGQG